MIRPEVSVVMGVYNGAAQLPRTLASVLGQEGVELEFVIVDDGSTDGAARILDECARADPRVRILRQPNRGLTAALIAGCAASRGRLIARQDAGDVSLPGRLRAQRTELEAHPGTVLVSCRTRFVGPGGEALYETGLAGSARAGLLALDPARVSGLSHHGSACFHREVYAAVGGYRREFFYAQDLDLWVRLAECGEVATLPDVLYEAGVSPGSISGSRRGEQFAAARLILESARRRRCGLDDAPVLSAAGSAHRAQATLGRRRRAAHLYFVAACLRANRDPRAARYYRAALQAFPLHLKALAGLLIGGTR